MQQSRGYRRARQRRGMLSVEENCEAQSEEAHLQRHGLSIQDVCGWATSTNSSMVRGRGIVSLAKRWVWPRSPGPFFSLVLVLVLLLLLLECLVQPSHEEEHNATTRHNVI